MRLSYKKTIKQRCVFRLNIAKQVVPKVHDDNTAVALYSGGTTGCGRARVAVAAKAILLDKEERVQGVGMNNKCAAGTGRFLNVMDKALKPCLGWEIKVSDLPRGKTGTLGGGDHRHPLKQSFRHYSGDWLCFTFSIRC